MNDPVARIIDVNFNRAGEALRTIEEYARFVVDSPALSRRCKNIRHDLSQAMRGWTDTLPPADRPVMHRDIVGDVGATIKTEAEADRPDAVAVVAAAFRRGEESLRVLSEYGKIVNAALGAAFETLRYRLYAVEPLLLADHDLKRRLARARLYVIITTRLCSADARTACREAVAGGADIVQLREKEMEDGEFHRLAADLADICREGGAVFLVNDRPHIASLVDAGGVHAGQGDLPTHLLRRLLGPGKIIGRSTSAPEGAENALRDGADYIGVGPVFETDTKRQARPVGLGYVKWASDWGGLPVFAIGGVNRKNVDAVLEAGARALCICSAVTMAPDIAGEAAYFKTRMAGIPTYGT